MTAEDAESLEGLRFAGKKHPVSSASHPAAVMCRRRTGVVPGDRRPGHAAHRDVPARDLAALWMVRVDAPRLAAFAKTHGCYGCYLLSLEVRDAGSVAHARAFLPRLGIAEDPATATAAGPLGAALVARGLARPGAWMTMEQGDAIGRACRIDVRVRDDAIDVAGACVVVGEGTLKI